MELLFQEKSIELEIAKYKDFYAIDPTNPLSVNILNIASQIIGPTPTIATTVIAESKQKYEESICMQYNLIKSKIEELLKLKRFDIVFNYAKNTIIQNIISKYFSQSCENIQKLILNITELIWIMNIANKCLTHKNIGIISEKLVQYNQIMQTYNYNVDSLERFVGTLYDLVCLHIIYTPKIYITNDVFFDSIYWNRLYKQLNTMVGGRRTRKIHNRKYKKTHKYIK